MTGRAFYGMLQQAASLPWRRLSAALFLVALAATLGTCSPPMSKIEQVRALGVLKVATTNSPTTYYEGPAGPTGYQYDLVRGLADALGVELELLVESDPAETLAAVRRGRAHLSIGGVVITPRRLTRYLFTRPVLDVVPQVVYRRGSARPRGPEELGPGLVIPEDSAVAEYLAALKRDHPDLDWDETREFSSEELLVQVSENQIPYTAGPSDLIAINKRYYPMIRVAFDLAEPQKIAWAFPLSSDRSLFTQAQHYLSSLSETELAQVRDRHFGHVEKVSYVGALKLATHVETRLPKYRKFFEQAAKEQGMDWRLLAAIGYQESHWNPAAVSPTGVRGIMQLTQQTARFLNVANREDPQQSIDGGARYIRGLIDRVDEDVPEPDRTWFALTAYNIGFGHLQDVRTLTEKFGGDSTRWIDIEKNLTLLTEPRWHKLTKYGYARGHEAKTYVGNVRTYYDMLVYLFGGPSLESGQAIDEAEPPPAQEKDPLNIRAPVL